MPIQASDHPSQSQIGNVRKVILLPPGAVAVNAYVMVESGAPFTPKQSTNSGTLIGG
jgi:hypothetical protein